MIVTTTRTVAGYELLFVWHGGEYIDICWKSSGDAFEVINVWDHEADKPRIERSQQAFEKRVDEWVEDDEMDRAHDLREASYGQPGVRPDGQREAL